MRGQKPLCGIRERFAETVNGSAIGRDEAIVFRQSGGCGQTRRARGSGDTSGEKLAA